MKCFVVTQFDKYEQSTSVVKVFMTREKALQFIKEHSEKGLSINEAELVGEA